MESMKPKRQFYLNFNLNYGLPKNKLANKCPYSLFWPKIKPLNKLNNIAFNSFKKLTKVS